MMLPAPVFAQENATSSSEFFTFEIRKNNYYKGVKRIFPTADGSPFADSIDGLFNHYEIEDFWLKVHADMTGYVAALNLLGEDFTDQPRQKCQASFAAGPLKPLPWRAMDKREVLEHYAKQAAIINYSLGVISDYDSLPADLPNPKWIKNDNPPPPAEPVTHYLKYPLASFPYIPAEIASDPIQQKIQKYVAWGIVLSFPESERPKHLDLNVGHGYSGPRHIPFSHKVTGDGPRLFGNVGETALATRLIVDWDYSRALATRLTELGRSQHPLYASYLQQLVSQGAAAPFLQLFAEEHSDFSTEKENILWKRSLPLFERGNLRWDVIKGVETWPFIGDAVPSGLKQAGIRVDLFCQQRRMIVKYSDNFPHPFFPSKAYAKRLFSVECAAPVFIDDGYYYMFIQTDEAGLETPLLWSSFGGKKFIRVEGGAKLEEDYIQAGNRGLPNHFSAKVKLGGNGTPPADRAYFTTSYGALLRSPHGVLYWVSSYLNREAQALSNIRVQPLVSGEWGNDLLYDALLRGESFSFGRDDHLEDVTDLRAFALGQGVAIVSSATEGRNLLVKSYSGKAVGQVLICAEKENLKRDSRCSKRP